MILKNYERMTNEWWQLTPKLRLIICDVECWCEDRGIRPVWTCFMRTEEENLEVGGQPNSVHLLGRGADMRMLNDDGMNLELADYINAKYIYDPTRPSKLTCLIHGPISHLHFQSLK